MRAHIMLRCLDDRCRGLRNLKVGPDAAIAQIARFVQAHRSCMGPEERATSFPMLEELGGQEVDGAEQGDGFDAGGSGGAGQRVAGAYGDPGIGNGADYEPASDITLMSECCGFIPVMRRPR